MISCVTSIFADAYRIGEFCADVSSTTTYPFSANSGSSTSIIFRPMRFHHFRLRGLHVLVEFVVLAIQAEQLTVAPVFAPWLSARRSRWFWFRGKLLPQIVDLLVEVLQSFCPRRKLRLQFRDASLPSAVDTIACRTVDHRRFCPAGGARHRGPLRPDKPLFPSRQAHLAQPCEFMFLEFTVILLVVLRPHIHFRGWAAWNVNPLRS